MHASVVYRVKQYSNYREFNDSCNRTFAKRVHKLRTYYRKFRNGGVRFDGRGRRFVGAARVTSDISCTTGLSIWFV
jgi:hypothetical protein